ncbi:MAG: DUF6807 domain-containing protein [Pirellulales bacterium]
MRNFAMITIAFLALMLTRHSNADETLAGTKPVPQMQVLPMPYDQASVTRNGKEISRYHFGQSLNRPFLYPIIGPSGRSLTRMGHPHDPNGHSHHNSVWVTHHIVNGVNFWGDTGTGKIRQQSVHRYLDSDDLAMIETKNHWIDLAKDQVLLEERRTMQFLPLQKHQWMLVLQIEFKAMQPKVTFEDTAFGLTGVRMAKTIGVHDGGGTIRNSEGQVNEKEVFRKPARWVDYSGPIAPGKIEGITLMDHPKNINHPTSFHVRGDGWMGSSLSFEKPIALKKGESLTLIYGLYIHSGLPSLQDINTQYEQFSKMVIVPRKK